MGLKNIVKKIRGGLSNNYISTATDVPIKEVKRIRGITIFLLRNNEAILKFFIKYINNNNNKKKCAVNTKFKVEKSPLTGRKITTCNIKSAERIETEKVAKLARALYL